MQAASPPPNPAISDSVPFERVRRVLIVDDNVDAAETLSALLNVLGYDSRSFDNPLLAILCLNEFQPDVCISDINMPEMNGYQFARAVRANPHFNEPLLIALTAYDWPEHRAASFSAGFDEHLSKSADISCIIKLLGEPRLRIDSV